MKASVNCNWFMGVCTSSSCHGKSRPLGGWMWELLLHKKASIWAILGPLLSSETGFNVEGFIKKRSLFCTKIGLNLEDVFFITA